jgi:hypothetical protein
MKCNMPRLNYRNYIFWLLLFLPAAGLGQQFKGRVLSTETRAGIGFVNIGIMGRNVGTVSDENGDFAIDLKSIYDNDSIKFSMIGYEPRTFLVSSFKKESAREIYLTPKLYNILEVKVIYHKPRVIKLGTSVTSNELRSGFSDNELGSELGIKLHVKGSVKLTDLNLNIARCTFDTVTYRFNVYQSLDGIDYTNILTSPIYFSFSRGMIDKVITFDLSKYSIIVTGDILISVELYKDMGPGTLLFHTMFFTGTTYHRKTSQGDWTEASGLVGMYLHGLVIK